MGGGREPSRRSSGHCCIEGHEPLYAPGAESILLNDDASAKEILLASTPTLAPVSDDGALSTVKTDASQPTLFSLQ